jgi:hypothetical protein
MKRYGSLRVSDVEREAVVDRLRVAAGEGRLEPDELEQRVGAALRARTYAELSWLVADLPNAPAPRSPGRPLVRTALIATGLAVATVVALAVVVLVVLATIVAATALWAAVIVFWLVSRGARRHLARAHRAAPRRVRRARPAGLI